MVSVIVASPPVFGETVPMLEFAAGLVRRGHSVTALLGSRFAESARAAGARYVPLPENADYDDRLLLGANPERNALPPGPEQFNWDLTNVFVAGMNGQHEAVQRLLDEEPDAALLCTSLFVGAWPVALGAPGRRPRRWVSVAAAAICAGDDATTVFGPLPGLRGEEAVRAHRAANAEFHAMLTSTTSAARDRLTELGATEPVPDFYTAVYSLPDVVAALTVPEFDFPRVAPTPAFTYAGILPPHPGNDPRKPPWWDELDGERPVVVVTQGTTANGDLTQLLEPTLLALADMDVLVIATVCRDVSALGIDPPANARVAEYVPFDSLLPRADLLITNGGAGGTQTALAAGVPVVMCGTTEEKPMNAARVAYHRLGIDLKTATPSREQIVEAVTTVLGDPSYREAVRRVSASYAAHDPITTVEALLR
ncbi:nucleotide disphospho-sugar-binding domain-containing protein [Actinophytocola sp.]|uniref:nucleotide disphospho-sugar-binding domain-containing protein n=1 Tax=Actinophytocola sp. TaxID=1872138 RepID=UPI00389AEF8C